MSVRAASDSTVQQSAGPYSPAWRSGAKTHIFCSGQLPLDPETGEITEGDITTQTRAAVDNLRRVLGSEGCSLRDVVKTTVFLASLDDFEGMNAVYAECFAHRPARSTVGGLSLPRGALVEIEAIAAV